MHRHRRQPRLLRPHDLPPRRPRGQGLRRGTGGPDPQGAEPQPPPLRQHRNTSLRPGHGVETHRDGQRLGARDGLLRNRTELRKRRRRQGRRGVHGPDAPRQRTVRQTGAPRLHQMRHRGLRGHRDAGNASPAGASPPHGADRNGRRKPSADRRALHRAGLPGLYARTRAGDTPHGRFHERHYFQICASTS